MLKCTQCGHDQTEGKFCEKCGGALNEVNVNVEHAENNYAEQHQPVQPPVQPPIQQQGVEQQVNYQQNNQQQNHHQEINPSVEKVKDTSRAYGTYFMKHLKRPGQIFGTGEREFKNAIISSVLVTLLISLAMYMMMNNQPFAEIPFASVVFGTMILLLVLLFVTYTVLFMINKMYGTQATFKEIASIYGAHLSPAIGIAALAFILVLIKSFNIGGVLIFVAIGMMLTTIPLFLISNLLTRKSRAIDAFYGYLIYLIAIGIAYVIIITIFGDTMVGQVIDELSY